MTKTVIQLFALTILLASCNKDEVTIDLIAGLNYNENVTKIEFLGEYSKADAIQFLGLINISSPIPVSTTCGFLLYRFHYKTHKFDNTEIIVSGLMGVPKSKNIKGLVSWQHGTNTYRAGSISTPSPDEGIGLAALFSANEYLLIAPDYIGLGASYEVHPYYHVKSTTNSVIDFIKVGEVVLNKLTGDTNHRLFLAGFSQGGGASVATQRALEISNPTNLQLVANAPIAGAYNLREVSVPYTLNHHTSNSLVYLGYLSNAYSLIYNQPLSTFIKEPYATNIPKWFDGSKDGQFMKDNLPPKVSDLFLDGFYNELNNNVSNWFTLALDENEMYLWQPINKIRFYYGLNDKDVIPQEAIGAYNYMKGLGGNVELNALGLFDHEESIIEALPQIQHWFNSLQ